MNKMMLLAVAALFGASIASAALTAADLTPQAVRTATANLQANQRQDYARQILEAVSASPEDETTKTQALTTAARALIAGSRNGGAMGVITEIFNTTPVTNLQGVSDLLATNNFGQKLNGMTDEQFDIFATRLVKVASQYIEVSGTDSPTLRISILAATFAKASSDPERTRDALIAALPAGMQAAAATYITASEQNNTSLIAAAAGVDAVESTPSDPDADKVVAAPEAKDDYLNPEPASNNARTKVTETDPEGEVDAKVPLIARAANDIQGFTLDAMQATFYEWDEINPEQRIDDPFIGALPGLGSPDAVPGEAAPNTPLPTPSPAYGNQRTY